MPVSCKVLDGKYRLVDKNGIAKNKSGSSLDSGGHASREECMRQARAVNANLDLSLGIAYSAPTADNWIKCDGKTPTFIKELIYEGEFQKDEMSFMVDEELIDHWIDTSKNMEKNGVAIPLPLKHTDDPEANRGKVYGFYKGTNPSGRKALYGKVEFRDEEAAKLAKSAQVSIFSPPEFKDGTGNVYKRPITHVALTDYPVIPSLQGFESIAASFVSSSKEAKMPLKELAARLKIECENDEQLEDTIVASFESLSTTVGEKDEEIKALQAKIPTDPLTVTASHRAMLKDNRTLKLDRLVGEKISPKVRDDLVEIFCSDDNLTLSLSSEAGDGGLFEKVVDALAKNAVVQLGETEEVIALSKDELRDPEKNPLLADAQRRAKAAK